MWQRVIWSDERVFRLLEKGRVWVTRPSGRADDPKYVQPSESQGPSVMVWACFDGRGATALQFVEGTLDSHGYIQLLGRALLPYARRLRDRSVPFYFMHDRARPHTARATSAWLEQHSVTVLPWMTKGADINPMENLWSQVARDVEALAPRTVQELRAAIERVWRSLDSKNLETLVRSLPTRVDAVLRNNGFFSEY
jgi:hypothetical protein